MVLSLRQMRESEVWKLISDISVGHRIFTVVLPLLAGGEASLRGLALVWVILIFLTVLVLVLAARYYWRMHSYLTLNKPKPKLKGKKKTNSWSLIVAPSALTLLIIGHFLRPPNEKPVIHITRVEIGWEPPRGPIIYGPADEASPDRPWRANVYYTASVAHDVTVIDETVFQTPSPPDFQARNTQEDNMWAQLSAVSRPDDPGIQVSASSPGYLTTPPVPLAFEQLEEFKHAKGSLYVMVLFKNKDSKEVEAEGCFFREGISPATYYCHDHNFP